MSDHRAEVAIYRPAARRFYEAEAAGRPGAGGAELQTVLLARGLVEAGLRVAQIIWPLHRRGGRAAEDPELIERAPYRGGLPLIGELAEAISVWRSMARAGASIYIVRGGGPQVLVAALLCRLRRRKLVFSASIDLDFDLERSDRSRVHNALNGAGLRRADALVLQTGRQLELARGLLGDGVRMEVIPSFAEEAEPADRTPNGFAWVGRLVDYKRPLALVRLAELVPEARFRMVYAETDETSAELRAELEARARELPNLELVGQLPRERVLDLISGSVALVSTSAAEGMPNVFLEAWARGVPVISLDYAADGRIAERGLGIVAEGSVEALADAVRSLLSDGGLRDRLASGCRDYVREVHSPPAVAGRWAELLSTLLDRADSGRQPSR